MKKQTLDIILLDLKYNTYRITNDSNLTFHLFAKYPNEYR